ncbi:unnamed protein product [Mucor hiemalis]
MLSYLIGGKCLEGVEYNGHSDALNGSSFSFSSSASSSLSDFSYNANQISLSRNTHSHITTNECAILFRRHGLSSQDLCDRLLQLKYDETWIELDASRNQITSLPSCLQFFVGLTQLVLTNNAITTIPEEVYQNLGRLQTLMLSENQIEVIPEDMPQYLPLLVTLGLDSNQIKSLPNSIGYWVNMRELRLGSEFGGNLLTELPHTISDMVSLVDLDLSFNMITTLAPDTFLDLPELKSINLSHNAITELPHSLLFGSCRKLATIDLSDNQIKVIPQITATDITRLPSLELLNLSDNHICIIPSDLLDRPTLQTVIKGNPVTHFSFHQEQTNNTYNQVVRNMIQRVELTEDYATSSNAFNYDFQLDDNVRETYDINETLTEQARLNGIVRETSATHVGLTGVVTEETIETSPVTIPETDNNNFTHKVDEENSAFLLHSLRELSLRTIITLSERQDSTLLSLVPDHIAFDLKSNEIQKCNYCQKPYVREWLSSIQLKSYRGHPSVVRKVRFCGTKCWQDYREQRDQLALAAQSNVTNQLQEEALQYILQHENAMEPGSIDWIMAAVTAATAQEEQVDNLANAVL